MAPSGDAQRGLQQLTAWVQQHPSATAALLAALYPAALILRQLILPALPYVLAVLVLATVGRSCRVLLGLTGLLKPPAMSFFLQN